MKLRCNHQIVYDMLKVLENRGLDAAPMTTHLMMDKAKISHSLRDKYLQILEETHLAAEIDNHIMITPKGQQYLLLHDSIANMLGEQP